MSLPNLLRMAWRGVSANKLRAALTTLGIMIGVASVISMLALGNGARKAVENQFRGLGANAIQVSRRMFFESGKLSTTGKNLSYEDGLEMAAAVDLIERVEMSVNGSAKVRRGRTVLDMAAMGITSYALTNLVSSGEMQPVGWPEGQPLEESAFLEGGRFFSFNEVLEGEEVCVLGAQTALDLFQGDDPIGQVIQVDRLRCTVIGVLAELEAVNAEERYSRNSNEALLMPIGTVIHNLYEEEPSVFMTVYVKDADQVDQAKQQIAAFLRERHEIEPDAEGEYQDDFEMTTRKEILGAQQEAAQTFSWLLTAMAAVSLSVGGIGIMNVMLVSVTERTREIGVRMAVGARGRDIVWQFLLEAIWISAGGGLLGIVLGVLVIPLAASLNQGMAVLAVESIPMAFGVALLTGIVFGLYPAVRAARLDPIVCLRYE